VLLCVLFVEGESSEVDEGRGKACVG